MVSWIETCRSTVAPWECDITEHFTIAFYLDRVEQASASLAEAIGLADLLRAGGFPRRLNLRFVRELRAGDSFHIDSAAVALDPALRLGHRLVDSAGGETVTWVEEQWELPPGSLPAAQCQAVGQQLAAWPGPAAEARPEPKTMAGAIVSARGRVRPGDLNEHGRFALCAFVHRFTDALLQASAAIGITSAYMQAQRRGFSTFELDLRILGAPLPGAPYLVETGVAHLGSSSIRFVHRMTDPQSGAEFARLGQFGVQLDLDARRPAPLPDEIRARAAALLLPAD
ncbi:MAG TPA: thioesterase family protein [Stellaceae bacterium]|jgi:acyl-CoA thioesterase FadM